jgi:hypothetical protein
VLSLSVCVRVILRSDAPPSRSFIFSERAAGEENFHIWVVILYPYLGCN